MSVYDRLRAPGSDLAAFFRTLATPSHRYTTSSHPSSSSSTAVGDRDDDTDAWETAGRGTVHLELFDRGLVGHRGAEVVLRAIECNPDVESVTLVRHRIQGDWRGAE